MDDREGLLAVRVVRRWLCGHHEDELTAEAGAFLGGGRKGARGQEEKDCEDGPRGARRARVTPGRE